MSTEADTTLVSVIMIFFNAEEFFEEAIASVLAQTHVPIELLLCDDGSTDGSTAIARKWAARSPSGPLPGAPRSRPSRDEQHT